VQVQSPFWLLAYCFIGPVCLRTALMTVARLEAQCIVFGAQGLLLTHELNPTAEFGINLFANQPHVHRRRTTAFSAHHERIDLKVGNMISVGSENIGQADHGFRTPSSTL